MLDRTILARVAVQAVVAGFIGAICIDGYLWATTIGPAHGDILQMWQWVASAVIGKTAFTSLSYAWLGLAAHVLISIAWAGGYAYLATSRAYMNEQWYVSGLIYGAVVYVFMQIVLLGANAFQWPASYLVFINALVGAHMICYGLPVALTISRMDRSVKT